MRRITMRLCAVALTPLAVAAYFVIAVLAITYGTYCGIVRSLQELKND